MGISWRKMEVKIMHEHIDQETAKKYFSMYFGDVMDADAARRLLDRVPAVNSMPRCGMDDG